MNTEENFRNRKSSWWKQRTKFERNGIILLIIAALVILALIIAIAVVAHKLKKKTEETEKGDNSVCLTPGCLKAAQRILQDFDESVNPCEDFYQFACGNYMKRSVIPDDKPAVNYFYSLLDSVTQQLKSIIEEPSKPGEIKPFVLMKKMYNTCMNTSGIEAEGLRYVKRIIREVGGWPAVEGRDWNEQGFDWKTNVYNFRRKGLDYDNFIMIGIAPDARNSSLRIISLDQSKLDLPRDSYIQGFADPMINSYYDYMVDLAVLFGADRSTAEVDMRNMINFESNLAKISLSIIERRDNTKTFNPMTIAEMQHRFPSIPWMEFLNNVIADPNIRLEPTQEVNVMVPSFIERFEEVIRSSPKRAQANHAFTQTLRTLVSYLPNAINDREQQFNAANLGISAKPPRWSECVQTVSQNLPLAVGALYARKHFPEDTKQAVTSMVKDIKDEFVKIVKELDWMDEKTKEAAIDKALSMTLHVGYPIEFRSDETLEDYYSTLNFPSNNYVDMRIRVMGFLASTELKRIYEPINNTDWRSRIATTDINAVNSLQENGIQVPAGILQGVFYDKNRPQYLNYGSIGYILGHEVTHGFDDQGKRFNKYGQLVNWWGESTNKAYADKAECFIKQYGDMVVPELGIHLNGENTQGENIADNGGIKEAYLAYNNWVERNGPEPKLPGLNYTTKQLFWLSTASCWCTKERPEITRNSILTDTHSPFRYRVNVPFGNIHYFAEDFNCPAGSKMALESACKIW